jgi:hypothetical protein
MDINKFIKKLKKARDIIIKKDKKLLIELAKH